MNYFLLVAKSILLLKIQKLIQLNNLEIQILNS